MLLQLHLESIGIAWATQILALFLVPLLLFAIAASVRRLTADGIRFPLWGLLATLLVLGGGSFVFLVRAAMIDPAVTVSPLAYIGVFSQVNSDNELGFYLYFLICAVFMLALGGIGLIQSVMKKGLKDN